MEYTYLTVIQKGYYYIVYEGTITLWGTTEAQLSNGGTRGALFLIGAQFSYEGPNRGTITL